MIRWGGIVICLMTLWGCENQFFDLVAETTDDPSVALPAAGMFSSLSGVPVQWSDDPDASGYLLSRRTLPSGLFAPLYEGADLEFLDQSALANTLYQYNLTKIRGEKVFAAGGAVTGAWDATYTKDAQGDNDNKTQATAFGTDTISDRIFYYSTVDTLTSTQVLLEDRDWYSVDLGPRLQMFFIFTYGDATQSGTLVLSSTSDTVVTNNQELSVYNPAATGQRVWFTIRYNPAVASTSTKTRVNYELKFKNISGYSPTN